MTDVDVENLKKERLTIDLVWANIFGLLILIPIVIVFGLPYYLLWMNDKIDFQNIIHNINSENLALGGLSVFAIMIVGVVIHELIHGLTWAMFTKNGFKSIKFGVLWKMLTPYCHCKEPLKVKHYILGAITPAIVLGFIPSVLAILIGNFGLLIFGMFFTMAGAGDFLIIDLIRKENMNDLVKDHPSEAGCYIYRKVEQKETQNNGYK